MKSKLLALFTIFIVPLLYFYDEPTATIATALASSVFAISYSTEQLKQKFLPTKILFVISFLVFAWLFTVGRSVWCSCSTYSSTPAFVKLWALLLLSYSLCCELALNPSGYVYFYRTAAFTGALQGIMTIVEYIEAPPIPKTWLDPASKELFRTRCCGIMTDPNVFAAFLSALFILTTALIITSKKPKEQLAAAVSLILSGTGIMMTLSRGSWIALFAGLIFLIATSFVSGKKPESFAMKILSATFVLLGIIFFSSPFKYRLFSITQPSDMTFAQRTLINKGIFASISKLPIVGHGLHTFTQVYPLYRIVGGDYPMNAHNEFLHSLVETGFLSSILIGIIALYFIRLAYKSTKTSNQDSLIFISVFVAIFVQNLSGFSFRILPTSVLLALSVGGALSSQIRIIHTNKKLFSQNNFIAAAVFVSSILVLIGSYSIFATQKKLDRATSLLASNNIPQATRIFESLFNEQPTNPTAANSLAMIRLLEKKPKEAIDIWKKALEGNKYEAIFPLSIARAYASSHPELADAYYQYSLQLDPASENFRLEYAKFLICQNKAKEAKEILTKGLGYSPGFHNVYILFQSIEELLTELEKNSL